MNSWIHEMLRTRYRRRVVAWGLVLAAALVFTFTQHRYIHNFVSGPYAITQADLEAIDDVTATPRYFVHVTGTRAIDTGIQQVTTRRRAGVETSRSVSASYYALAVGDRLLIVKGAPDMPLTATGELSRMPPSLDRQLFDTPRMEGIRGRFYPFYLDNTAFRVPGYVGIGALLVLAALLVVYGLPAWRYQQDVSSHPLVKRVASWGDPIGIAVEARRAADAPRHSGGGWLVTDTYLVRRTWFTFDLLRFADLLWAYKRVTKHSVNFIPTGKSYAAVVACYGGTAEVKGREAKVDATLAFAAERAPWAVFGYTDERNALFRKQTQQFGAAVEQRKQEWAKQPRVPS
jgi:hypothetical protein